MTLRQTNAATQRATVWHRKNTEDKPAAWKNVSHPGKKNHHIEKNLLGIQFFCCGPIFRARVSHWIQMVSNGWLRSRDHHVLQQNRHWVIIW